MNLRRHLGLRSLVIAHLALASCTAESVHQDLRTVEQAASPVAQDTAFTTLEDTPFEGRLSASDEDGPQLTFTIVGNGNLGTAVLTDDQTGDFRYTPEADQFGSDTFTFEASDGAETSGLATVTVTIDAVNDAPVLSINSTLDVLQRTTVPIDAQSLRATDPDNTAAQTVYSIVSPPSEGRLEVDERTLRDGDTFTQHDIDGGRLFYVHTSGAENDSFSFTLSDGAQSLSGLFSIAVTANQPPTIESVDGDLEGFEGEALTFTARAEDPEGLTLQTFWNLGDGFTVSSLDQLELTHTYDQQGRYAVTLLVMDHANSVATDFVFVDVENAPPSVNVGDDVVINEGEQVTFSATVSDPGDDTLTHCWDFGDGSEALCGVDLEAPTHTFNGPGSYTVTLEVSDGDALVSDTLLVEAQNVSPTLSLEASAQSVDEGDFVQLDFTATDLGGGPLELELNFGDGQAPEAIPHLSPYPALTRVHRYPQQGQYTLSLTATDANAERVTETVTLTVNNVPPSVALEDTESFEGSVLTLAATIADPGADTLIFVWDFGDGGAPLTTSEPTASHRYINDGAFTVSVTADDGTATTTASATARVANILPQVVLVAGDGVEGEGVTFTAASTDPGDDTLTHCWSFGDGSPLTCGPGLDRVEHTYNDDGSYTLTLTVNDGSGEVTRAAEVNITNAPIRPDIIGVRSAAEGQTLTFNASLQHHRADALVYCWRFNDGSAERCGVNLTAVSHTYTDDGAFALELEVTDEDQISGTAGAVVSIDNVAPSVEAGPDQVGSEGDRLSFLGAATDPGEDTISTCWDFGDGSDELCQPLEEGPVAHLFEEDGVYTVSLRAFDEDGGEATSSLSVTITNVEPEVAILVSPQGTGEGEGAAFGGSAEDPGRDVLEVCWFFGDGGEACGGTELLDTTHVYVQDGDFTATLQVSDDDAVVRRTVSVVVRNLPPRIVGLPTVYIRADEGPYTYEVEAIDPGRLDTLTYGLDGPEGALLDQDGRLLWPEPVEREAPHLFTLRVEDGQAGADVQTFSLKVGYEDIDGDGAPDACERANPPLDEEDSADGPLDFDGDGESNAQECLRGTDPNAQDAPSPPTIESPFSGQTVSTRPVSLVVANSLADGGNAVVYDFQLFADPDLTDLVGQWEGVTEAPALTSVPLPNDDLVENRLYWWRARAFNSLRLSAFTPASVFRFSETPELPEVPDPIGPRGRLVDQSALFFEVGNPTDPELDPFELEIEVRVEALDEPSHTLRFSPDPERASTTVALPEGLAQDTSHHWRVRAVTQRQEATQWSESVSFRIDLENAIPDAPTILSPAQGASVAGPVLVFIAAGADDLDSEDEGLAYFVRLATDAQFLQVVAESPRLVAGDSGEVVWRLETTGLAEDATFYWEVSVRDREAQGGSARSRFSLSRQNDPPGQVALISPTADASVGSSSPELVWRNTSDPEGGRLLYNIEVASDGAFQNITYTLAGIPQQGDETDQTAWRGAALRDTGPVFWRVRAVDSQGARGPWSPSGSFTLQRSAAAPPAPSELSPEGDVVVDGSAGVVLTWRSVGAGATYEVEIFNAEGSLLAAAEVPEAFGDEASHTHQRPLSSGGHHWRVRAVGEAVTGPWTVPALFKVGAQSAAAPPPARSPRNSQPLTATCSQAQGHTDAPSGSWFLMMFGVWGLVRRRR